MASDPVPPPDGRVIVGFRESEPWGGMVRLPAEEIQALIEAAVEGPPVQELMDEVRAAVTGAEVVEQIRYDEAAKLAEQALVARLAEAPDAATVKALFAGFERLYPDRVGSARGAFLSADQKARSAALPADADTDACVAVLVQAAVDYAVPASWWPEDCRPPPGDQQRAERYAALRGDEDCGRFYGYLLFDVERIDAAAKGRAPRPAADGSTRYDAGLIELAEVVSLVVPTLTGVALERLVDAVVGWLRRRRPPIPGTERIVRIYGPSGELLKEVQVTESTASSGT